MSKGVVLFAHNSRQVDYLKLSLIAGKLAKKNLQVPVSLITDESTVSWARESKIYDKLRDTFDNVITEEIEQQCSYRILHDGENRDKVPFKNSLRSQVWNLTPYDRTLLIDSDFLIFSDNLSKYWDVQEDFMISSSILDIHSEDRMMHFDRYISEVGTKLSWATTIMFTKNEYTRSLFNFVSHIKENYTKYAEIYRFDDRIYRNDIAFSLAKHILSGFFDSAGYALPPVFSTIDKDILIDVDNNGILKFLIKQQVRGDYVATSVRDLDIHIMNKQSLIRNFDKLMRL